MLEYILRERRQFVPIINRRVYSTRTLNHPFKRKFVSRCCLTFTHARAHTHAHRNAVGSHVHFDVKDERDIVARLCGHCDRVVHVAFVVCYARVRLVLLMCCRCRNGVAVCGVTQSARCGCCSCALSTGSRRAGTSVWRGNTASHLQHRYTEAELQALDELIEQFRRQWAVVFPPADYYMGVRVCIVVSVMLSLRAIFF